MKKTVGFIGLGNMGLNMVLHLLDKGYEVHAWNRSSGPREIAAKSGVRVYNNPAELLKALPKPRVIWSMVAAEAVDEVLVQLDSLEKGDIFVDGVNSYYKDSIRRSEMLAGKGVNFIDCGVSGGIQAAREGACLMAGGDKKVFTQIETLFADLAAQDGYGYFGPVGAGHYVKMVHNAVEYAMMQALGEGMNLIKASAYKDTDMTKLTDVWSHASIIAGNLVKFLHEYMKKDPELKDAPAAIGSLGTGKWAVQEALDLGVPVTNIAASVFNRFSSRGNDEFARKIISALRAEFGGHNENERDIK